MNLTNVYKATKVIEAIENYSNSDDSGIKPNQEISNKETIYFQTTEYFWNRILKNPEEYWNKRINFNWLVLSTWLPRIPGLCWTEASSKLRDIGFMEIFYADEETIELYPTGKTKMVAGGLGTIKLPPNDDGKSLLCLCSNRDSSGGIPILIYPEVLEHYKLKEGHLVKIKKSLWQHMSLEWSQKFATTAEIPRGFIVVDSIDQIEVIEDKVPIICYPYSIMEYQKGDALYYDFVYKGVDDINNLSERAKAEAFFLNYAKKENRNGRYLLNCNCIDPIFEATYMSPAEIRQPSERAKLELLYKRIRDEVFDRVTLDKLIEILPRYYNSSTSIRRLAKNVGVSQAILQEDNAASMSAQLINYCFDTNRIEELSDRMIVEYPQIFNS